MNIEKTYKIIGKDNCEAKFVVSPAGFIQIELRGSCVKMRAPLDKIDTDESPLETQSGVVGIIYKSNSKAEVFWQVIISRENYDELSPVLQEAKSSWHKLREK